MTKFLTPLLFLVFGCAESALCARLVTLSPALTELVYQLQRGNEVVGVSAYSDYPEVAKSAPKVGSLFHPNAEKIIALKPTLIFSDAFTENPGFLLQAKALQLTVQSIRVETVEALFKMAHSITNQNPELLKSAEQIFSRWINAQKQFRFLFFTWTEPPILSSRHTFFSDLFTKKGGTNLVPLTIHPPYLQVSEEWLLQIEPDVVFFLHEESIAKEFVQKKVESWWPGKKVRTIFLPAKDFARTSLSPILALPTLESQL